MIGTEPLMKMTVEVIREKTRRCHSMAGAYGRLLEAGLLLHLYKFRLTIDGCVYQYLGGVTKTGDVITDLCARVGNSKKVYLSEYHDLKESAELAIWNTPLCAPMRDRLLDSLNREYIRVVRDYITRFIGNVRRKYQYTKDPELYAYKCFMLMRKLSVIIRQLDVDDVWFSYSESDFYYTFVYHCLGQEILTYKMSKTARIGTYFE